MIEPYAYLCTLIKVLCSACVQKGNRAAYNECPEPYTRLTLNNPGRAIYCDECCIEIFPGKP